MLLESIESRGRFWVKLLVCVGALIAWRGTAEPQDWPKKRVKIVVAFGPGGTGDILGRIVASELSLAIGPTILCRKQTGQQRGKWCVPSPTDTRY
jgi:tripartite-type tricarboxylate transporter receptor subunit TctC